MDPGRQPRDPWPQLLAFHSNSGRIFKALDLAGGQSTPPQPSPADRGGSKKADGTPVPESRQLLRSPSSAALNVALGRITSASRASLGW